MSGFPCRKPTAIWEGYGLTPAGAAVAEWILPALRAIAAVAPERVVECAMHEALFQVHELPTRHPDFVRTYLADAPSARLADIMAFEPVVAALLHRKDDPLDADGLFDSVNEAQCNVTEAEDD